MLEGPYRRAGPHLFERALRRAYRPLPASLPPRRASPTASPTRRRPEADDNPRGRRYGSTDYGAATSATSRAPAPTRSRPTAATPRARSWQTGHGFFGSVSKGLASVIEYAFQKQGRPNGYILGQDAGGAFVAGLRYGEGILYTKDAGSRRVYWQGPSIGYDAGAEGSKVMMLVYNLRDPEEIYQRFGGVDGSAYLVGGVGVTFQKSGHVVVAPIRVGRRPSARRQHRLSQVHAPADLEPVLRRHGYVERGRPMAQPMCTAACGRPVAWPTHRAFLWQLQ